MNKTIAFIVANEQIVVTIKQVLKEMGREYPVYCASMEGALDIADQLMRNYHTRVIISLGLTAKYLRKELTIPVLGLMYSNLEFVNAVKEARKYSQKILIVCSGEVNYFARKSIELFGEASKTIQVTELRLGKSIEEQAKEMLPGYDVVISGSPMATIAKKMGKVGILFDVDTKMVEFAVLNAEALAKLQDEQEEKYETIQAIVNHSSEGIILTDNEGKILILNPAAQRIIGLENEECIGKEANALFQAKNLINVLGGNIPKENSCNNHYIILNEVPIYIKQQRKGSMLSIRKAEEIEELGQKVRRELLLKGHIAKKTFQDIIGQSDIICMTKRKAETFAKYDSTVLILGETGTGKEVFAQSIHNASLRRKQPFVAVNCAALPENLLESELFGYVKGAFTGAKNEGKAGLFEMAHCGTIFLDEISEIPLNMQARLLRVIQEKEVVRIGDDKVRSVDVRIISASNQKLFKLVKEGKFREDLYYRLCVLELRIPPLRERKEDIAAIVYSFIQSKNIKLSKNIKGMADDVLFKMQEMDWSGNVRQLDNFIEKLMILTEGNKIMISAFQEVSYEEESRRYECEEIKEAMLVESLADMETRMIQAALKQTKGNKTAAAKILGIDATTLWRKLKNME